MGLFSSQFMQTHAGLFCPVAARMSFFKYNLAVVKVAILPVVERIRLMLNLIWLLLNKNYTRQESNLLLMVEGCHQKGRGGRNGGADE
jgi:hypothetical protein